MNLLFETFRTFRAKKIRVKRKQLERNLQTNKPSYFLFGFRVKNVWLILSKLHSTFPGEQFERKLLLENFEVDAAIFYKSLEKKKYIY